MPYQQINYSSSHNHGSVEDGVFFVSFTRTIGIETPYSAISDSEIFSRLDYYFSYYIYIYIYIFVIPKKVQRFAIGWVRSFSERMIFFFLRLQLANPLSSGWISPFNAQMLEKAKPFFLYQTNLFFKGNPWVFTWSFTLGIIFQKKTPWPLQDRPLLVSGVISPL